MKNFCLTPITLFFPKSILMLEFANAIRLCEYEICPAKKSITAQLKEQEIEFAKNKYEARMGGDEASSL